MPATNTWLLMNSVSVMVMSSPTIQTSQFSKRAFTISLSIFIFSLRKTVSGSPSINSEGIERSGFVKVNTEDVGVPVLVQLSRIKVRIINEKNNNKRFIRDNRNTMTIECQLQYRIILGKGYNSRP